jgi:hypothetical protein
MDRLRWRGGAESGGVAAVDHDQNFAAFAVFAVSRLPVFHCLAVRGMNGFA